MRSTFQLAVLTGVIFGSSCTDSPRIEFDPETALEKEVSGEFAYAQVKTLVEFGPRPAGSEALEMQAQYLETQLGELGWTTQRQEFEASTPRGKIPFINLRARFGGAERWDDSVQGLLCSHYDTKWYENFEFVGANDAGSSSGLLVELARVLAKKPALARELELVFFDGEEAFGSNITPTDGLYGSKYYASQFSLKKKSERPQWGVLLDMVGDKDLKIRAGVRIPRASLRDLAESKDSPYQVDIEAVQARVDAISLDLLAAADDLGVRPHVGISPDYIIDDHVPLNVAAGIPTIDLIDFDYPYWHTPGDTMDKISAESLEISGRVALQLIEKYLMP